MTVKTNLISDFLALITFFNFMPPSRYFFVCLFCLAAVSSTMLASCGKKESAVSSASNTASFDTTEPAKTVPIVDTNHHLFFRPKPGSVERYHVIDRMTMSSSDTPPSGPPVHHSATSTREFYLHQTVGKIGRDSSVTLTYRVDSIRLSSQQDTSKLNYSSNELRDRMNDEYRQFNILVGKDFTVRANKYGDLDSILDVSQIAAGLLAPVPDSIRNQPRIRQLAKQQAEEVANDYITRVLVHNPTRALVTDTTWRDSSDVNLDVAAGLSFPVHINASETVRGLENRGDRVLAVLEDNTTTTPRKRVFQEGPTTATIQNFIATSHSVAHIEDSTGLLFYRAMQEKRNFTLVIESKEHAGEKRTVTQNGAENLVTEILE